jgi:glycosyltransferase involved in cell wall biosynthesis
MCSSLAILISWAIRNRREKNKCILLYLVYMPVALPALLVSKLSGSKTVVIVPDLAEYIFTYQKQRGLRGLLLRAFSSLNIVLQSKFDGYVLLTKYMNEKLNPHNRPSIVIEGFINPEDFAGKSANKERDIHPIMYAGILSALYGLQALIKGFMTLTDESLRLWIFGAGELEDEIKAYEREDPRIVFFGKRRRDEVLEYELKADLLVNIRPVNNEFTKYSFPSKMIEYMASGMPVLTTALPGIPDEYFDYVYLLRDESIDAITKKLSDLFSIDRQEYFEKGKAAKEFILNKKNYIYQAKKMLDFLNGLN